MQTTRVSQLGLELRPIRPDIAALRGVASSCLRPRINHHHVKSQKATSPQGRPKEDCLECALCGAVGTLQKGGAVLPSEMSLSTAQSGEGARSQGAFPVLTIP